jgi:hypothetical protein
MHPAGPGALRDEIEVIVAALAGVEQVGNV